MYTLLSMKYFVVMFAIPSMGGIGKKCSITLGSISSQRSAFFSFTLLSRATIHRHTEIFSFLCLNKIRDTLFLRKLFAKVKYCLLFANT